MMPVTVEIRRASDAFVTRERGRLTRHGFSFGPHYDPENVAFGPMVCHDDHLLSGGQGFADHSHADLEIVTWVLRGALAHTNDRGAQVTVAPGTVLVLSAGSGVVHAEVAAPGAGPTRFVQVWLTSDSPGTEPSYATSPVTLPDGELVPVASGSDPAAPVRLGTAGATFSRSFWVSSPTTKRDACNPISHPARASIQRRSSGSPASPPNGGTRTASSRPCTGSTRCGWPSSASRR